MPGGVGLKNPSFWTSLLIISIHPSQCNCWTSFNGSLALLRRQAARCWFSGQYSRNENGNLFLNFLWHGRWQLMSSFNGGQYANNTTKATAKLVLGLFRKENTGKLLWKDQENNKTCGRSNIKEETSFKRGHLVLWSVLIIILAHSHLHHRDLCKYNGVFKFTLWSN